MLIYHILIILVNGYWSYANHVTCVLVMAGWDGTGLSAAKPVKVLQFLIM